MATTCFGLVNSYTIYRAQTVLASWVEPATRMSITLCDAITENEGFTKISKFVLHIFEGIKKLLEKITQQDWTRTKVAVVLAKKIPYLTKNLGISLASSLGTVIEESEPIIEKLEVFDFFRRLKQCQRWLVFNIDPPENLAGKISRLNILIHRGIGSAIAWKVPVFSWIAKKLPATEISVISLVTDVWSNIQLVIDRDKEYASFAAVHSKIYLLWKMQLELHRYSVALSDEANDTAQPKVNARLASIERKYEDISRKLRKWFDQQAKTKQQNRIGTLKSPARNIRSRRQAFENIYGDEQLPIDALFTKTAHQCLENISKVELGSQAKGSKEEKIMDLTLSFMVRKWERITQNTLTARRTPYVNGFASLTRLCAVIFEKQISGFLVNRGWTIHPFLIWLGGFIVTGAAVARVLVSKSKIDALPQLEKKEDETEIREQLREWGTLTPIQPEHKGPSE